MRNGLAVVRLSSVTLTKNKMKIIKIIIGGMMAFATLKAFFQLLPEARNFPTLLGFIVGLIIFGGAAFYLLKSGFSSNEVETKNQDKNEN